MIDRDTSSPLDFSRRGKSLIGQKMFKILDLAKKIESSGEQVIHLELGDPVLYPPGRVINETIMSLLNSEVGYTSSSGLYSLRKDLSGYLGNKYNKHISIENIVVSVANLLIYQVIEVVCDEVDSVSVFTPAFPTYFAACKYIGVKINEIPLSIDDSFQLTKKSVDKAFSYSPKVIVVNSGNNPTGAVYSEEILSYVLDKAVKNNCWVISDETYSMLSFIKTYFSGLEFSYRKLIVISSFSKVFSLPGYRIGYAVADPEVCDKISLSSSTLYSCLSIFTQRGVRKGIPVLDEFTNERKKHYEKISIKCAAIINRSHLLRCIVPDAAFYLFIDINKLGIDDESYCLKLLKSYKVAVTPGSSFGYNGFVRVSMTGVNEEVITGINDIVLFSEELFKSRQG